MLAAITVFIRLLAALECKPHEMLLKIIVSRHLL